MSTADCTVCGGGIPEREDIGVVCQDARYAFCSDEHKEEFVERPDHFI